MGQNKGKRAEREIVAILQPIVDELCSKHGYEKTYLQRNSLQSRKGGYDILGVDWLALEVKHQESFSLDDWWKQTLKQCGPKQTPVLIYRRNNVKWRVRMHGSLWCPNANEVYLSGIVDVDLDFFLGYFRRRFDAWLEKSLSNKLIEDSYLHNSQKHI